MATKNAPIPAAAPAATQDAPLTPKKLGDATKDFLASSKLSKGADSFCRVDAFVKAFKDYCKESKIQPDNEMTIDYLSTLSGVSVEKDVYKAYPGKNGALQKASWVKGVSVVSDDIHGANLTVLLNFAHSAKVTYDTSRFMKYGDFLKCFEAFCLENRHTYFKPSARLLKDLCTRMNLALDTTGVRKYRDEEAAKGKWLLGVDFSA